MMDEQELPLVQITEEDIAEANQLSLHCPICASAVENNLNGDLTAVLCARCGTLYHKACWQQSGGKCAVLGCGHTRYEVYGAYHGPVLKVKYTDLPAPSANGRRAGGPGRRTKRLKAEQRRQVERLRRPGLLARFWRWLLDQIKVG